MSMSLAEDGTRASVIDSDHDVRLFDLDDRSQLGQVLPVREDGGDIGRSTRHRAPVAFSETSDPCNDAPLRLPANGNARSRASRAARA